MTIKIKETNEYIIPVYSPDNTSNWAGEIIGNADDPEIIWNADEEVWVTSKENWEWWENYISDLEKTDIDIENLVDDLEEVLSNEDREDKERLHGSVKNWILSEIGESQNDDYDCHRIRAVYAIDEIRKEYIYPDLLTKTAEELDETWIYLDDDRYISTMDIFSYHTEDGRIISLHEDCETLGNVMQELGYEIKEITKIK